MIIAGKRNIGKAEGVLDFGVARQEVTAEPQ
jgi:hypothetical protein